MSPVNKFHKMRLCCNNSYTIINVLLVVFLLLIQSTQDLFKTNRGSSLSIIFTNANPTNDIQLKLNCTPGEKRLFKYDSFTRFWGNSSQTVNLNADIAVYCMEVNGKQSTLKYFVEIVNLVPNILKKSHKDDSAISLSRLRPDSTLASSTNPLALTRSSSSSFVDRMYMTTNNHDDNVKVEPILEEIGEISGRVKRSVSGWFSDTWVTVKDFFGKMFNSADGPQEVTISSKSHSGDSNILGQCKPGSSSSKGELPFDESIFDDVAPTFKIGANREYGTSASESDASHNYDNNYDNNNDNNDNNDNRDNELSSVSFFDKPAIIRHGRHRRSGENTKPTASVPTSFNLPFEFVQTNDGKIVDVRFSDQETDLSIKNFKRHICDLFATHLDRSKPSQLELTPVGKHVTKYYYDDGDGKVLQETLNKINSNDGDHANNGDSQGPLLTRVLAVIGVDRNGVHTPVANEQGADKQPFNEASGSTLDRHHSTTGGDNNNSSQSEKVIGMSIIRDINSTDSIKFGSQATVHDMSQFRIKVKQIQQISANQMISTAGQLSMSLVRPKKQQEAEAASNRVKRAPFSKPEISIGVGLNDEDLDVANLLHVSTSFSMKLNTRSTLSAEKRNKRDASTKEQQPNAKATNNKLANLDEIKRIESELKMVSSSVMAESVSHDGHLQRLDLLRDQVALRLNEEASIMMQAGGSNKLGKYDSGLGLTQIILDYGRTSKKRGSLYSTLEEIIDLEYLLKQENQPDSISRLLRETIKTSQLNKYCHQALEDGHTEESNRLKLNGGGAATKVPEKRLGDCKKILQLLLRANGQDAIELTLNLIDDCNKQLTTGLRHEEIGYGPGVKYYRRWRQQFIELLSDISRPKESLLDKLMSRLHYNFATTTTTSKGMRRSSNTRNPVNNNGFEYTMHDGAKSDINKPGSQFNETAMTDDTNNNDGDGSIVMTITNLATKPSVSQEKRIEISVKLLNVLRNTTCSLYDGPDLDILESIGNLNTVVHEIAPKIVHLAKKCRHQDQYTVACIHAAQGQLQSGLIQRWLLDLVKSTTNVTCMVKSEIVATLVTVSSMQELMQSISLQQQNNKQQQQSMSNNWPHHGLNQLDKALLDIVATGSTLSKSSLVARKCLRKYVEHYMRSKHASISRSEEVLKKLSIGGSDESSNSDQSTSDTNQSDPKRTSRNVPVIATTNINKSVWSKYPNIDRDDHTIAVNKRYKRYIAKDFWDEATCKRWSYDLADKNYLAANEDGWLANNEDNFIYAVNKTSSTRRKNELLLEREDSLDPSLTSTNQAGPNVSRRHKCTGTRTYGPRNAEATIRAEIVNDIVGPKDDNKFLARFTVAANFLGSKVDIGRMYLWHQRQTTRAYVNMFGKTLWDTSHSCHDKTPRHLLYMPLFDFNIWVVKINVGIRLHSEMGFYSSCRQLQEHLKRQNSVDQSSASGGSASGINNNETAATAGSDNSSVRDELHLFPTISIKASGEASAKFVVARAGMSIGSHYSYQGQIRISRKPESCMSIASGHEPMNVTFSSWYQLWNNDCQYWGSRTRGEPHAVKWSINKRRSTTWVSNECLGLPTNRTLTAKIEP